jgi:hypothetical protein
MRIVAIGKGTKYIEAEDEQVFIASYSRSNALHVYFIEASDYRMARALAVMQPGKLVDLYSLYDALSSLASDEGSIGDIENDNSVRM